MIILQKDELSTVKMKLHYIMILEQKVRQAVF